MTTKDLFLLLSNIKTLGLKQRNDLMFALSLGGMGAVMNRVKISKMKPATKSEVLDRLKNSGLYLEGYKSYMATRKIRLVSKDLFPSLGNIYNKPPYLYALGEYKAISPCVAVIGARDCSAYGKRVAYEIGKELAVNGYTVVSGMAYGVDSQAHQGAIDGGGVTIAVLGSGVDVCYPKVNRNLYQAIQAKGLVVSEFALQASPTRYNFPLRNRIISGISQALIVVEAKKKSGTMITVEYAIDQGRDVYSVPGSIFSDQSLGTNDLLRRGAMVYTGIDDLLNQMI